MARIVSAVIASSSVTWGVTPTAHPRLASVLSARATMLLGASITRGLRLLFPTSLICSGCADRPAPLEDRPLATKIHFEAIHYAEGKDQPRQLVVRGTLDGPGQLELNPNHLMLDSDGRIQGSTLLGYRPIPVQIKLS